MTNSFNTEFFLIQGAENPEIVLKATSSSPGVVRTAIQSYCFPEENEGLLLPLRNFPPLDTTILVVK